RMAKSDPSCARVLKPLKARIPEELLRRASAFSLRFWFKHLNSAAKSIVTIGSALLLASLFLCCGSCGIVSIIATRHAKAVQAELAQADALWDQGDKAMGAAKYRGIIDNDNDNFVEKRDQSRLYGRPIDFEYESGHSSAGKTLIDSAERKGITPSVNHPDAKQAWAAVEAEKAEKKRLEEVRTTKKKPPTEAQKETEKRAKNTTKTSDN
ncbi:MAG TPA: hypothetical protein VFE62_00845, partial [Gemmataceae bacterium]|nr:hypothetical protein [Gemmataceae bacterium]